MLSVVKALIPGSSHWPEFLTNTSEQFEARFSMVEIQESNSLFLANMSGSKLPIVVSHGEGRASWQSAQTIKSCMRYCDNQGNPTEVYPYNPNGSPEGATAFSNDDGRVLIMMPHPERVFRTVQCSWHPKDWQENSPWYKLFSNARQWIN